MAAITEAAPPSSAQAAKNATSTISVAPGQTSASMPNVSASAPCRASIHQDLASSSFMMRLLLRKLRHGLHRAVTPGIGIAYQPVSRAERDDHRGQGKDVLRRRVGVEDDELARDREQRDQQHRLHLDDA